MHRHILAAFVLLSAVSPVFAESLLDRLGAVCKDGHFSVDADLQRDRLQATPVYAIEVEGSPCLHIVADALDGSVQKQHLNVDHGSLIVRGKGLRPNVSIESLDFESSRGITDLRFKGVGIWKPLVAMFGGIGRSSVRKLHLRTDILSVLKGEVFGGPAPAEQATPAGPPPEATGESAASAPAEGAAQPSMFDLVAEVRILDMTMTAFAGRTLEIPP